MLAVERKRCFTLQVWLVRRGRCPLTMPTHGSRGKSLDQRDRQVDGHRGSLKRLDLGGAWIHGLPTPGIRWESRDDIQGRAPQAGLLRDHKQARPSIVLSTHSSRAPRGLVVRARPWT